MLVATIRYHANSLPDPATLRLAFLPAFRHGLWLLASLEHHLCARGLPAPPAAEIDKAVARELIELALVEASACHAVPAAAELLLQLAELVLARGLAAIGDSIGGPGSLR